MDTNERVAKLEANEGTIFHQLTEIKNEVKDIRRLTNAVEKMATKMESIDTKVDSMDKRLNSVVNTPAEEFRYYKRTIISCILTGILSAGLGALIALMV